MKTKLRNSLKKEEMHWKFQHMSYRTCCLHIHSLITHNMCHNPALEKILRVAEAQHEKKSSKATPEHLGSPGQVIRSSPSHSQSRCCSKANTYEPAPQGTCIFIVSSLRPKRSPPGVGTPKEKRKRKKDSNGHFFT